MRNEETGTNSAKKYVRTKERSDLKRRLHDKPSGYISVQKTYILKCARYVSDCHDSYCVWQTRSGQNDEKARYVSVGRVICRDGCSHIVTTRYISSFSLHKTHFTTCGVKLKLGTDMSLPCKYVSAKMVGLINERRLCNAPHFWVRGGKYDMCVPRPLL